MATIRAIGCFQNRTFLQRILQVNNSIVAYQQARCFHRAPILLGVDPIRIQMPALSPTMEEGTIVQWLKKEGDPVAAGDALCEIETDKATLAMDADEDGIMAKILIPEGTKGIKIMALIGLMVPEGEDYTDVDIPTETETGAEPASAADVSDTTEFMSMRHSVGKAGGLLSPAVRQLTEQHGLDPASIPPTGPHGRLLKGDVLRYLESPDAARTTPPPTTAPDASQVLTPVPQQIPEAVRPPVVPIVTLTPQQTFEDLQITNMRNVIAKRLLESTTTVPHAYCSVECNMNEVETLRRQLKEDDIKLSINDFIIKAAGVTLRQLPQVNASWTSDAIQLLPNIDISVAVATDKGLLTPIVTNAAGRGLLDISTTVKDLATRAREGKLQLHEFQGGSFSISNLGMFGISHFTAVINPPQSCILAIGTSRLAPSTEGAKPVTMTTVTMSSDARVVDGELAARFLDTFRKNLENPLRLGIL